MDPRTSESRASMMHPAPVAYFDRLTNAPRTGVSLLASLMARVRRAAWSAPRRGSL